MAKKTLDHTNEFFFFEMRQDGKLFVVGLKYGWKKRFKEKYKKKYLLSTVIIRARFKSIYSEGFIQGARIIKEVIPI